MAPTIRDVAAAAGVSKATVSRVLNGGHWVSPDAAAAVHEAMARVNYVASHSARALSTGRSGAVALVITEPPERLFEDPTFAALVTALSTQLPAHQLTLYITLAVTEEARAAVVGQVRSGLLDGVILASTHGDDSLFAQLLEADVPAVVYGEPMGAGVRLPYVNVNNRAGAAMVTKHLRDRGCRHIGLISGPHDTAGGLSREAGFRDALGKSALRRRMVECEAYTFGDGERAMVTLLGQSPDVDGVFAASDLLAAGALGALRRLGRDVPSDIAVVGFDDSVLAVTSSPMLTTVKVPVVHMAEEVVRLLMERIDGGRPESVQLSTQIVVRDSA